MLNELDCRGMECPAPVLQVRNILENEAPATITVRVDNEAARQNVSRLLEHSNFQVNSEVQGAEILIIGTRKDGSSAPVKPSSLTLAKARGDGSKKIMVMITSVHMGHGDDGLGDMLMFNFIKTLKEMGPDLWRVVFVNSGVNFTSEGSDAVPILKELAGEGVQILACGACLAYFHILDKIQIGVVTNMLEIVTSMQLADSVVTI